MNGTLPDVNVLLALAWPNHQFHTAARQWFAMLTNAWSTCAITQLGFVRLSSNPAYSTHAKTPLEAVLLLRQLVARPGHEYVDALPPVSSRSFEDLASRLQGHKQTTDAYLAILAQEHALSLVTFDRRLRAIASPEAEVVILAHG